MLTSELRKIIIDYLDSKITIAELEDWLVPNLPILIRVPDSTDTDIVSALELGIAELNSGLRDHNELKEYLLEVLREVTIKSIYPITSTTTISSSNITPNVGNQYVTPDNQEHDALISFRQVS
jgi:hypothetical protein